jgi:hypothetical protein
LTINTATSTLVIRGSMNTISSSRQFAHEV